ncbi:hypothetical protein Y1Q_0006595 [Alligator mississippiensis]|uniref:Uncharacterized protein n=1 Tax=Alligator mississippiensis TaxID=8496 RepID=A0A151NT63_ALLMI|nr:hypothetical protein Y1Q_0006595 [Alligator mississippiensis]
MSEDTFLHIITLLLPYTECQDTVMCHPIAPEKRVATAIMKLAIPTSHHFIENQFSMAPWMTGVTVCETELVRVCLHTRASNARDAELKGPETPETVFQCLCSSVHPSGFLSVCSLKESGIRLPQNMHDKEKLNSAYFAILAVPLKR